MAEEDIVDFISAKKLMADRIKAGVPNKTSTDVFRVEIKIHPIDEIAWIASQKADVKIYGANQDNSACIAGVGEAASVSGRKGSSLKKIFQLLRAYLKNDYPYLQWYGGFCFDAKRSSKEWADFGAYRFVLPRFELASDAASMIFCCNIVGKVHLKQIKIILKELEALSVGVSPSSNPILKVGQRGNFPSNQAWDQKVQSVLKEIVKGKLQKVVLARQTKLKFLKVIDPWDILRRLFEVTPNSYHFCFQFGKTAFLGASPERLYRKFGRAVISEAIAGTSARGQGVSSDNRLKEQLLASLKNNYEHECVVQAIDKGLSEICQDHQHSQKPQILTLGNGHHLITAFEGKLKDGVCDEDIIKALHPTPAVGGVPQTQALKLIGQLEGFERGWYTGLIGYVGLDWSEFVVGIRSGLVQGKEMTVYAGAGIVAGSDAQEEWQEIENKISNFIKLIQ
ncbi:MAG: isochorismate synthase [Candidatus Omnitrophica bacterium]|nr:isochorismate synthase [Candidatus Omnitrophota bacterium]